MTSIDAKEDVSSSLRSRHGIGAGVDDLSQFRLNSPQLDEQGRDAANAKSFTHKSPFQSPDENVRNRFQKLLRNDERENAGENVRGYESEKERENGRENEREREKENASRYRSGTEPEAQTLPRKFGLFDDGYDEASVNEGADVFRSQLYDACRRISTSTKVSPFVPMSSSSAFQHPQLPLSEQAVRISAAHEWPRSVEGSQERTREYGSSDTMLRVDNGGGGSGVGVFGPYAATNVEKSVKDLLRACDRDLATLIGDMRGGFSKWIQETMSSIKAVQAGLDSERLRLQETEARLRDNLEDTIRSEALRLARLKQESDRDLKKQSEQIRLEKQRMHDQLAKARNAFEEECFASRLVFRQGREKLVTYLAQLESRDRKVEDVRLARQQIVRLNVGGLEIETSRLTFTDKMPYLPPSSLLASLVSGRYNLTRSETDCSSKTPTSSLRGNAGDSQSCYDDSSVRDEHSKQDSRANFAKHEKSKSSDQIFLDSDGGTFSTIVSFLRDKEHRPPIPRDFADSESLCRDAAHYGVRFCPNHQLYVIGGISRSHTFLKSVELCIERSSGAGSVSGPGSGFGSLSGPGSASGSRSRDSGRQFSPVAPMDTARAYFASGALRQQVVVAGGQNETYRALRDVEIYDALVNRWYSGPSLIKCRRSPASIEVPSKSSVFVFGGFDGDKVLNSIEFYDARTRIWNTGANMTAPRSNAACCFTNNEETEVLLIGGSDGHSRLATIDVYDFRANRCRLYDGSLTRSRSGALALPFPGGGVFVLGGLDQSQQLVDTIEFLPFTAASGLYETSGLYGNSALEPLPHLGGLSVCLSPPTLAVDAALTKREDSFFLTGGRAPDGSNALNAVSLLENHKWTALTSTLSEERSAHRSVATFF